MKTALGSVSLFSLTGQRDGEILKARGDTHMGKSDLPEGSIIILYLHFLHERTNN